MSRSCQSRSCCLLDVLEIVIDSVMDPTFHVTASHTVHEPQSCPAGSQNAMHCPDASDGLGAKRAKHMSLPDKDFTSAWLMKAQSQLEQSQADNELDADIGMCDAENDAILTPAEESGA